MRQGLLQMEMMIFVAPGAVQAGIAVYCPFHSFSAESSVSVTLAADFIYLFIL